MSELRFKGTLFAKLGKFGAVVESCFDVPWTEDAVLGVFGDDPVERKDDQQLWSATRSVVGSRRGLVGLEANCAAVLDRDCADVGELDRTVEHLTRQGLAFVVYTSWSHGDPNKVFKDLKMSGPFDCFRVVVPYSRDLSPGEHRVLVQALFGHELPNDPPKYVQEAAGVLVTLDSGAERAAKPRGWDAICTRPAQGYYVPTPHALLEVYQGKALDVDAILARPTTARVSALRGMRQVRPATHQAIGAMGVMQSALDKYGYNLGEEGYSGWRRSSCPSCQDPSPSLTVRPNGDGVDVHCHAGCKRKDVLAALGLSGELWHPPTELRLKLDEQLLSQELDLDPISAEEVGPWLEENLEAALRSGEATVVQSPAGSGKSYWSARVMSRLALEGERLCYATQEHQVAHETRMQLDPAVRARSVHLHSPLIQVGDDPVCSRVDELKERVFEFGESLMGSICPKCPQRETCDALAASKERAKDLPGASVVFCSHAGIRQVYGVDANGKLKGADTKLLVDEMPSAYARVIVTGDDLSDLSEGKGLLSADLVVAKVVRELARATKANVDPGDVYWTRDGKLIGNAGELAEEWGRLYLRPGARPSGSDKALLQAADALIRLYCHNASGGLVERDDELGEGSIAAMLPDACHEALVSRKGVLLSATPLMAALPDFALRQTAVKDGAKVRRVQVLRSGRGGRATMQAYYDDELGARRVRDPEDGEEPGIPWPAVDSALARALEEADRIEPGSRVLFCTFKGVADVLRLDGDRLGNRVVVGHFGALRGKNDWQEGARDEVSVVYCFGAPRMGVREMLLHLGFTGDAADQAWVAYAAGELTQAEGRLRLPRRTKPCTVFVEGDVAPSSWTPDLVDQVLEHEDQPEQPSSLLEAALRWYTQDEVAQALGIHERSVRRWRQPGRPPPSPEQMVALKKLAFPTPSEAVGLLNRSHPRRQALHVDSFSWVPLDE